jgi:putative transposase
LLSLIYLVVRSVLRLIVWSQRSGDAQALEVMVLRHQVDVLNRQVGRARFETHDRLLLAAASRLLSKPRWEVFVVRPETLLRWHHRLVARKAAWWGSRSRGRPPTLQDVKDLIVRFAKDNPRWGYRRIQGELKKLGHEVSAMTIRDVLRRSGLGPAPRRMGPSWSEFLHAQASAIVACDFFTVYGAWGKTIYVLFAIELSSRRVHLGGCTARPNDAWVTQQARNLSMTLADTNRHVRFLIHDRDTKFTAAFDEVFRTDGLRIIKTPIRSPQANAIAERWVKSARTEVLDWLLIFGERHLRTTLREYVAHYNRCRPHRSLDLTTPEPYERSIGSASTSRVHRRGRLGGLINEYYEAA